MKQRVKAEDRIGQVFGRLTVVSLAGKNNHGQTVLRCKCVCGSTSEHSLPNIRNGRVTSCGCLKKEVVSARFSKHKKSTSDEYRCWSGVVQRCINPNNNAYHDYGGRGITVCPEWLLFENFYRDMGDKPSKDHSLDRIDNDGPYCKEYCRWATPKEQANNKRRSRILTLNGITQSLTMWARTIGVSRGVLLHRLRLGWDVEAVLTTPTRKHILMLNGKTRTLSQWAKEYGIESSVIRSRLQRGWPVEDAVTTPVGVR